MSAPFQLTNAYGFNLPGARRFARWLVVAIAATALQSFSATNLLVWPPPPSPARIAFIRQITAPADIGVKGSFLGRLGGWITGESKTKQNLDKPFGLTLDDSGNILVTDTGDNSVSLIEPARKKWTRWQTVGQTRFKSPVAIARAGQTIYVADSALGKIIAFDTKRKWLFEITRELERPAGLAVLRDKLFVADSQRHRIAMFDLRGNFKSAFGRRGGGDGEFNFPTHVSVDFANRVYVTDSLNNRIQVFDEDGKFLRAFGSAGDGPGSFSRPKGVAVDTAGHVYVVDAVFDNVQIFDAEARLLLDFGEAGKDAGEFWLPNAIVINRANEIYVADTFNHRIQVFRYIGKE